MQYGGMQTIQEDPSRLYAPLQSAAGHLRPRSTSATFGHLSVPPGLHPAGHLTASHIPSSADMLKYPPGHSSLRHVTGSADLFKHAPGCSSYNTGPVGAVDAIKAVPGHSSADVYNVYNSFDGSPYGANDSAYPGANPPGFSVAAGHPYGGPAASAANIDLPAASGRMHRGPYYAQEQAHPLCTQAVTLPPDDNSWSATTTNAGALATHAPPLTHSYSHTSLGPYSHVQPQQQPPHWPPAPSQGRSSVTMSASWNNSPHSSALSRQTPSPPNPPPGFLVSSNKGPRHLLIMYALNTPTEVAGAQCQTLRRTQCMFCVHVCCAHVAW